MVLNCIDAVKRSLTSPTLFSSPLLKGLGLTLDTNQKQQLGPRGCRLDLMMKNLFDKIYSHSRSSQISNTVNQEIFVVKIFLTRS